MIFSASETERKISRDELSIVKSEIKTEFGTLKTLMEIKEQNDRKRKQKWAAIGIPVMGSKSVLTLILAGKFQDNFQRF